jgi:DNA polymerase-3 subunit alpha
MSDGFSRVKIEAIQKAVGFVHLHVHTSFSLREGALSIATLSKFAKADKQPAIAITDTNNLFGALEFSEKLAKEGIQPIIGAQLAVDFGDGAEFGARADLMGAGRASIVLIATTELGYTNLMRLATRTWLDPKPGETPHVAIARLAENCADIIALTGGPTGPIDRALEAERLDVAVAGREARKSRFSGGL